MFSTCPRSLRKGLRLARKQATGWSIWVFVREQVWIVGFLALSLIVGCQSRSQAEGSYIVGFDWDNGLRDVDVMPVNRGTHVSVAVRDEVIKDSRPIIAAQLQKANLTKARGQLSVKLLGSPPYLVLSAPVQIFQPSFPDLLSAVEAEDVDKIASSISSHNNIDQRELPSGRTALFMAAAGGHVKSLMKLLHLGADPNIADFEGDTPLGSAVVADNLECTRLLLAAGAHIDQANGVGLTPLMKAADLGRTRILELLLRSGANAELRANNGKTALVFAQESDHAEAAKILERTN